MKWNCLSALLPYSLTLGVDNNNPRSTTPIDFLAVIHKLNHHVVAFLIEVDIVATKKNSLNVKIEVLHKFPDQYFHFFTSFALMAVAPVGLPITSIQSPLEAPTESASCTVIL